MKRRTMTDEDFLEYLASKIETEEQYLEVLKAWINNDTNALANFFHFKKCVSRWSLKALELAEKRLFNDTD